MHLDRPAILLGQMQRARDGRRQIVEPFLPCQHDLGRLSGRFAPGDGELGDHADQAGAEVEFGDDAKTAVAAAAQRPKQIGICLAAHILDTAGGIDDLHRQHAVARQPKRTSQQAKTAAKRVPGNPDRKTGAGRDRPARRLERLVDRAQRRTGADRYRFLVGGKRNGGHATYVDHQIGALRKSFIGMAAGADRETHPISGRPANGAGDRCRA